MTLADSPEEVRSTSKQPLNLLVVHQQDIQSVVNAMWLGGATAVTIQGTNFVPGNTKCYVQTTEMPCTAGSATTITMTMPFSVNAGVATVKVTTPGGSATINYTYT